MTSIYLPLVKNLQKQLENLSSFLSDPANNEGFLCLILHD